jgi:hypothetical protein
MHLLPTVAADHCQSAFRAVCAAPPRKKMLCIRSTNGAKTLLIVLIVPVIDGEVVGAADDTMTHVHEDVLLSRMTVNPEIFGAADRS